MTVHLVKAPVAEFIGTYRPMTIVLNTPLRGVAGKFAPFAIGMTVAFRVKSFGPVMGASIDPAGTLGPAVGMGRFTGAMPDMAAQFIGAAVAARFYRFIFPHSIGNENGNAAEAEAAF